jgi:hypothetical protein
LILKILMAHILFLRQLLLGHRNRLAILFLLYLVSYQASWSV